MLKTCNECGKSLSIISRIYCSNKCQLEHQYRQYIVSWKLGLVSGCRGIRTKNFSAHVYRYLREKYGEKCSRCGWDQNHPITGTVPLEIDHTDGNAENNKESNLRLLCPNCHSLTAHYRNLNSGRGRQWRREKYAKLKS